MVQFQQLDGHDGQELLNFRTWWVAMILSEGGTEYLFVKNVNLVLKICKKTFFCKLIVRNYSIYKKIFVIDFQFHGNISQTIGYGLSCIPNLCNDVLPHAEGIRVGITLYHTSPQIGKKDDTDAHA